MNKKIIPDNNWLEEKRSQIEQDRIKKRFYAWLTNLFKPKTTLERYGFFIVILQLVTLACSVISYITAHEFTGQFLSVWVSDANIVLYLTVGIIALIELVKIIGLPFILMSVIQLKRPNIMVSLFIAATFIGSMYSSYEGAEIKVLSNTAPTLVNIDSIKNYHDAQIASITAKVSQYRTNKEYRNSKNELYHKVLKDHIEPLESEALRLAALRDSKVDKADSKNATIESDHHKYTNADASTMAWIALGSDLVKLFISFITAWFLVSAARDFDAIHAQEDETEESEYGMIKNMPPTVAASPPPIDASQVVPVKAITNNPRQIPPKVIESVDNSKIQQDCIVVKGFNKGNPMTKAEIQKKLRDTKSRLKNIEAWEKGGRKKGENKSGTRKKAESNIAIFQNALKTFG